MCADIILLFIITLLYESSFLFLNHKKKKRFLSSLGNLSQKAQHRDSDPAVEAATFTNFLKGLNVSEDPSYSV